MSPPSRSKGVQGRCGSVGRTFCVGNLREFFEVQRQCGRPQRRTATDFHRSKVVKTAASCAFLHDGCDLQDGDVLIGLRSAGLINPASLPCWNQLHRDSNVRLVDRERDAWTTRRYLELSALRSSPTFLVYILCVTWSCQKADIKI